MKITGILDGVAIPSQGASQPRTGEEVSLIASDQAVNAQEARGTCEEKQAQLPWPVMDVQSPQGKAVPSQRWHAAHTSL